MEIKVCGPGCANCTKTENIVHEVVAEVGANVLVEKVTDFAEMAKLGVLSTPAIVIDGEIKCVGKVPSKNEILQWIKK
ncbi:MAG: glutaredoxin [Desulfobacterales bacterium SG8_35_2]|jgi:small redox-active disulfide protein 2|nr:MAG: glutaredoxin [Desulfobacterales bacterium SG8_35_2]